MEFDMMAVQNRAIDFWYEFASPYSYLAAMRIETKAQEAKVSINWKPFLLGPLFHRQGYLDSPFNAYPAKRDYMWRDVERCCQGAGIPFRRPDTFPGNGLNAARLALLGTEHGWCSRFTTSVYLAYFGRGEDIATESILKSILAPLVNDDVDRIWDQAMSADHKARLRAQTEHAAELGIFGAPTFMRGQEMFWGNDRLDAAVAFASTHMASTVPNQPPQVDG